MKKPTYSKSSMRAENCSKKTAVLALNEGFEHEDYMHICYAMIDVCDAVYMQKDWQQSKGARMELQYAKDWKKQIIYEDETTRED